jgi:hypothetical protein
MAHPNIKADDNPDDTGRVAADTEQLLLDACSWRTAAGMRPSPRRRTTCHREMAGP